MATWRLLVVWAVLDGAVWQGWLLLVATGGSATGKTPALARHVTTDACVRPKRPCGALDKKEEQGARRQRAHWRD